MESNAQEPPTLKITVSDEDAWVECTRCHETVRLAPGSAVAVISNRRVEVICADCERS